MKKTLAMAAAAVLAVAVYFAPLMHAQMPEAQPPQPQSQSPIVTVPGSVPQVNPELPSQPAVAVKEVQSPAAPSHYTDQAIWALMVSFFLEFLKQKKWFAFLTPESTERLKTQFGFVAALLTAAGIHFAVTGSVLDGNGAAITISGLSLDAFKDVGWQWASQQAWYRVVVKEGT